MKEQSKIYKRIFYGFRLNAKIADLIDEYAKKYKTTKTQIVEAALIEYFKSKNEDLF